MKVFKFGGASVRDAAAVINVAEIVGNFKDEELVIIVSAMGKTTNGLEEVIKAFQNQEDWKQILIEIKTFHLSVAKGLFDEKHQIFSKINTTFDEIDGYLSRAKSINKLELYSEIVSQGEVLSTRILRNYLNENVTKTTWADARKLIKTDSNFIDARVDWKLTQAEIDKNILPLLSNSIIVTQGFIGSNQANRTTTLGREGSDFSGAIFSTCLKADSLTVWKDVPGILDADPKLNENATIIKEISYKEASELTYYGAKVIHPRTIRPLAQNGIKLYVRPFNAFPNEGTVIGTSQSEHPTSYILKDKQVLVNFNVKDYSFIDEKKLSFIFQALDELNIKINLMQNSAISFSICIDKKFDKVEKLLDRLKLKFDITHFEDLELFTVKNFSEASVKKVKSFKNILLEQRTTKDIHVLYKPNSIGN